MAKKEIIPGSIKWENICKQCGICCLVKYCDKNGNVWLTDVRCPALDKKTRKCSCYSADVDKRDNGCKTCKDYNGSCLNYETLQNDYVVPSFCPYVQKFRKTNVGRMPKTALGIDWDNTVSEAELKPGENLEQHIIPGSNKYFWYNPIVNKRLHEKSKKYK